MKNRTQLYRLWMTFRCRCNWADHPNYKHYGGRGIDYDPRWDDFATFKADVGDPPKPDLTFDRIDNNKGYWPGNVRWATRQTQARNRNYCRASVKIAIAIRNQYVRGVTTQQSIADQYGLSQITVSQILRGVTWK